MAVKKFIGFILHTLLGLPRPRPQSSIVSTVHMVTIRKNGQSEQLWIPDGKSRHNHSVIWKERQTVLFINRHAAAVVLLDRRRHEFRLRRRRMSRQVPKKK